MTSVLTDGQPNTGAGAQGGAAADGQAGQQGDQGQQDQGKGSGQAGDQGQNQQGDQGQQGGQSQQDDKGQAGGPPDKYDLKLPEGSPLDEQAAEQVAQVARDLGLTNEQAQQLLEHQSQSAASIKQAQQEQYQQEVEAWAEQVKADKEIGGDKFDASITEARKALDRFGTDALKQALDETGLGNHPELVRLLARVGKAMAEDKLTTGASKASTPRSPAEVFYPSQKQ